jgi:tetratricopeptide (TPR) repeat protein
VAGGSTHGDLGDALTLAGEEPSASASAWRLDRGSMLGRYVVLARLGEGGMGVVYAAYDPELDRKVALKLLHRPDSASEGGTSGRTRLVREAQAMAKLSHPNVVAVHDVGTMGDRVFVALEFVDGCTLSQWRKQAPRSWRDVLDVMQRAGRGLAAAHAAGLLHRDFKPDNVMIDVDGRVRVMDFGIARAVTTDDRELGPASPLPDASRSTALGATRLLGTPAYMAPEQLAHGPTDARTDVFAFGVSLWELLYGARPFAGASLPELASNVLAGRIVSPPKDSRVPAWLRRIATRAIARAPDDRFPTMDALLAALGRDPARTRARTGAVIAVALVPVALLVGRRIDEHRTIEACEQRADLVAAVWNDDARERARAGLVASGATFASTTWDKTRPWIDEYAAALSAMRVQTCRDADVDEAISSERRDRIDRCLDARQAELAALALSFEHADRQAVDDAVMTASTITRLEICHDERVLAMATNDRAPEAPRSSADRMLREAFELQQAKRREEALALTRRARDAAREEADPVLEASAELRIARLLEHAGDPEGAEAAAQAAYFVAGSASVDDVAAEAANALVRIVGLAQGRAAEGLAWARHARMIHARIGAGELGTREIDLADTVAQIHRTAGDFAAARTQHERALELVETSYGPEHPRNARVLNNLGLDQLALGDYETALATYARAADLAARTLGTDHPVYAAILSNTAVAHFGIGDNDAALAEHQQALELLEAQLGPGHPDLASSLNGIASIHFDRGDLELAREYLERTFEIVARTRPPGHGDIATMATNLGSVYEDLGQHERAIELHAQALEIWERAYGPDHPDVAVALNNLGTAHFALQAYEEAEREHRRALAIRERAYGPGNPEIVSSLLAMGLLALVQDHDEEALDHLRRGFEIVERNHVATSTAVRIRDHFGRALVLTGSDPARGRELVTRARTEATEAGNTKQVAEIDAWLADHPAESTAPTQGATASTTTAGRRTQRK